MNNLPYKNIIALSVPYGASISILYLYGYWHSFNINIFEFVDFSKVFQFALFPLIGSFMLILITFALTETIKTDLLPPGGGADTRIGRFGRKYWRYLIALQISIIFIVALFGTSVNKWLAVAGLISVFSVPLSGLDFFIRLIPNLPARRSILFLLLFSIGFAFWLGKIESEHIKNGNGKQFLDTNRSNLSFRSSEDKPVIFLGYLGEHFAFYETFTKTVVLVKPKQNAPLYFKNNPKRS